MKIIIVRHGKTNENKEKRLSGNSNNAQLIEEGIKHAKDLVSILKKYKIEKIFSSPLDRAIETIKPFAKELDLEIIRAEGLREFDFGLLDSKEEKGEALEALKKRREDLDFKFPEGESYNDVLRRLGSFLEKLIKQNFKRILIVGHGGVNRTLIYLLNKDKKVNLDKIHTPNDIVYVFDTNKKEFTWVNTITKETGKEILFREDL
ncbi:histidine phosphatase family protein [Candidatus Pacearchaeota archaeon]|nr:histidine phosphatase family protein [Candidatus Pacearchaeota archaeon]